MSDLPARVLIVAEHASVRFGGEAILPYHYFRLLRARGVDAHLIVHERTRGELEDLFEDDRAQLHFVRDMLLQKVFYRAGRVLPRRIDEATFGLANQLLTQWAQRGLVRTLLVPGCVLHQPIPVSPRFPSLLYDLGAPLVAGPLNGGMEYPAAFRTAESFASRTLIAVGRSLTNAVNTLLPGKRRAAVVLVANARTRRALPAGLEGQVLELVENGVDATAWQVVPLPARLDTFVFIGRLVDWKALDIVIDALKTAEGARLKVIGDGAMRTAWEQRARDAGVTERVEFLGWLSQQKCAAHLAGACALVLPSVFECGGAVVLEAMAIARPVIATAWGGPVDYLNASCGMLLEPGSREALVEGFSSAMMRLMADRSLAERLGSAGRERLLQEFEWNRKIDAMLDIYRLALRDERGTTKPDFRA